MFLYLLKRWRTLADIKELLMAQEEQLQTVLELVRANGAGLARIIDRLSNLPPVDNPDIQDEIDGILAEARSQQAAISAVDLGGPPE